MTLSTTLPFSPACENNKQPIGDVLAPYLQHSGRLLEVGSGTGQHAYHFARRFPHIAWQPSDRNDNLPLIRLWVAEAACSNLAEPLALDVSNPIETSEPYDFLFSANTLHIMSWPEVETFFKLVPRLLKPGGHLFIYGPFNYGGHYTSTSNAQFDTWLKAQAPHQGLRDIEDVQQLATAQDLIALDDVAMPANNRTLIWRHYPDKTTPRRGAHNCDRIQTQ